MALFLPGQRIAEAIQQLGHSRAKQAALFDFLVVKRTLALKNQDAVAITQTEPALQQALEELGACGGYEGRAVKPERQYYFNPFASRDKRTRGYRPAKYLSNGTNTTIGSEAWRGVISLSHDDPRKSSLAPGYLDYLEALVLNKGKGKQKPHIIDAAVWYFRSTDVEPFVGSATSHEHFAALVAEFKDRLGLTNDEVAIVFQTASLEPFFGPERIFVAAPANPLSYLPGEPEPTPIVTTDDVGSCSLDLVIALAAKNFVILTGPSGTGKSRSALRLAQSIQHANAEIVSGSVFELVTVGPDWTTPKKLLGYRTPFGKPRHLEDGTDSNESYEITKAVRLLLRASHPDVAEVPHFLIFDEMNLSHVERYFAPFLSLMEAANVVDEKGGVTLIDEQDLSLIADLLKAEDGESAEAAAAQALLAEGQSCTIPSNLFFIGTVNVDETTYMFSPKVLDRAHVIELEAQRPIAYLLGEAAKAGEEISVQQTMELLQESIADREEQRNEKFPNPADILNRLKEQGFNEEEIAPVKQKTARALDGCYQLLLPVGFPFGYRIPKEVFAYLRVWFSSAIQRGVSTQAALEQWPDALDRVILQKVLPKIHGNKRTLGDSLKALAAFLAGNHGKSAEPARYTLGINTVKEIPEEDALILAVSPQMKLSSSKLLAMNDRLGAAGHVSFVS
jgi:hypothetical protein